MDSPAVYYKNLNTSSMSRSLDTSIVPSPRRRQQGFNSVSQVVCRTLYHTIENFGHQLPIQITEALKFKDRNVTGSASISKDGWAWFVIGRRLFVWQAIGGKQPFGSMCKELPLPPSDLAHKSNLISIFTTHGNQIVSCIAVSPEGLIRYWPNITNDGISIEHNAELQGQECESVHCILPAGFIVSTTTATILLVETNNFAGRHSLYCRPLSTPSGWLGGIGRRMSSLIFGGMPTAHNMDNRLLKVLIDGNENHTLRNSSFGAVAFKIFVLTGSMLQKWSLVIGEQEKFIYECNLHRLVADNFLKTVWNVTQDDGIETSFLDVQLCTTGTILNIVLLVTAVNNSQSSQVYYAFATINVGVDTAPVRVTAFHLLRNIDFAVFNRDQNAKRIQFFIIGQTAYLYNNKVIICIPAIGRYEDVDVIEIADTAIIGANVIEQIPVFFSRSHGFISLIGSDITPQDLVSSLIAEDTDSPNTYDTEDNFDQDMNGIRMNLNKDGSTGLKSAFLHYASKRVAQCKAVVNEIFPIDTSENLQLDAMLDTVAIKVSLDLINDTPVKDPRWIGADSSMGSTVSLQILSQLQEKRNAWNLYMSFLKDTGLWKRLSAVTWNNNVSATTHVFAEHAEKLVAMITFRNLQMNEYADVIESAINTAIKEGKMQQLPGLTPYDLFYKQVSIINEGLKHLCATCNDFVHEDHSVQSVIKKISNTNTVLLEVMNEIGKFRSESQELFLPNPHVVTTFGCEVYPWTVCSGDNGLRNSLLSQINVTLKYGIQAIGNATTKQQLFIHLVSLITIVLEGWETYVESVKNKAATYKNVSNQYHNERFSLINHLLQVEEYEQAAICAEKFQEFNILVLVYEKTKDSDKLDYYMNKFGEKGLAKCLFSYYIEKNKVGQLLSEFCKKPQYEKLLSEYLLNFPWLAWIQASFTNDFLVASKILLSLAFKETALMRRKKSLLSLGKLSLLASSGAEEEFVLRRVNVELDLIAHQEDLPECVLSAFNHDFDTVRVFSADELIKLYICEENTEATAIDFSKAIDLLDFVTDEQLKIDLRNDIWCKAILRDEWPSDEFGATDVINFISQFLFFKIIQTQLSMGRNVMNILPSPNTILECEELGDLPHNAVFQYLYKVGYEHFSQF